MERRGRAVLASTLVALALAMGCQRGEKAGLPPTPIDPTTIGTITGEVRFTGTPPAQTELSFGSVAECKAKHEGPLLAGDVLVADGKVQNAIVYVSSGLGERVFAVPEEPVVIDQEGCLFVPRVAAAQVGQPIRFLNSDPLAHNVRGKPKAGGGWNLSLGMKGAARTVEVAEPDPLIVLTCDIHPWMKAYLGIFPHPYFAVTGADGRFMLERVPAGEHEITVWHERLGTTTVQVTLEAQSQADVTVTLGGE